MGWLAFAPIPGPTTDYFGISTNQVDLFSVISMLVGIPVGFIAIWCADIIGICNASLRGTIRLRFSLDPLRNFLYFF